MSDRLTSWDAEFGYELVDDAVKLSYPDLDPALAAVTEEAVEDARKLLMARAT